MLSLNVYSYIEFISNYKLIITELKDIFLYILSTNTDLMYMKVVT